jgi:hypothetical protein
MLQVLCDRLAACCDLIHHRSPQDDATGLTCPGWDARLEEQEKEKRNEEKPDIARNQNRRQFVV